MRGPRRPAGQHVRHRCTDHELDPLAAVRVDIERYMRWLQDVRHYQPSTVSRRLSIVVGFYRRTGVRRGMRRVVDTVGV